MPALDDIVYHTASEVERRNVLQGTAVAIAGFREVLLAFAFGSFVGGQPFRDLDIGVVLSPNAGWRVLGRLSQAIWLHLGRPSYDIDVVSLMAATPDFRRAVGNDGVVLYEAQPHAALEFWTRATSESMDLGAWRAANRI